MALTAILGGLVLTVPAIAASNSTTASAPTTGIFPETLTPSTPADSDGRSVELGVRFSPQLPGRVTALQYYQGAGSGGATSATLWTGAGKVLATVPVPPSKVVGWRTIALPTPVSLTAGQSYVASYHAPHGHYAVTENGLANARSVNGFNLPSSAGVYSYSTSTTFPASAYRGSNYLVDVVYAPTNGPLPTHPTSTSTPTSTTTPPVTTTPPATTTTRPPSPTTTRPSAGGKPGAGNTGVPAGTVLTPYTGPKVITVANTIIDGKDIKGSLVIQAKNVVIKNSKIHDDPNATAGIQVKDSGSATITDSEIYNFQVAITYTNWTAIRVNIHDMSFDGIKMSSNARLQDSWIHAPKPTSDAHWDGIQVQNGVVNTVITGNNIDAGDQRKVDTNSALFLVPDLDQSTNGPLTVTDNWLNGGNYTVYCLRGKTGNTIGNISIKGNKFGADHKYGPTYVSVPVSWSGNVWEATGQAVNP